MFKLAVLAGFGLALSAGVALADEPVATAGPDLTAQQVDAWIKGAPPVEWSDDGVNGVTSGREAEAERKIHGEMGVAVGTGGYRSAYVASTIPLSKEATLSVAVSETRGRGLGYGYGYPGGYGSGLGSRGSFGVGLALGEAASDGRACRRADALGGRLEPGLGEPLLDRRCGRPGWE